MTILSDFNFCTSTKMDDSYHFVDCAGADFKELAKNVRAGVIRVQFSKVIIAVGNQAAVDNFTNVVVPVNQLINAMFDRFGCVRIKIWVMSLLPRPGLAPDRCRLCKSLIKVW